MSSLLTSGAGSSSADLFPALSASNVIESKETILKNIRTELDKHRTREVTEIFNNSVLHNIQREGLDIIWDLVPIICQRLRGLNEFRFRTFNFCRQILIDLTEFCNPKELLIIYLSELENDFNLARFSRSKTSESSLSQSEKKVADEKNENGIDNKEASGDNDTVAECDDDDIEENFDNNFEITDSNCFKALLKPFELLLRKLPKKRNETLKSVLSQLNEHVSRLSLSVIENFDFNTGDRAKLSAEPGVKNLNSVLNMYVDFLEAFVNEVDIVNGDKNYNFTKSSVPNIQRMILLKSLLRLLDYPLKQMDLLNLRDSDGSPIAKEPKETKSTVSNSTGMIMPSFLCDDCVCSRSIAVKVTRLISCLHSSFFTLLNRTDLITPESEIENNSEFSDVYLSENNFCSAMSVMSYILSTEPQMSSSNFFPRVYTHIYTLGVHLPYVRHLLDNNQFLVYDKGLELLTQLLEPIKDESLEVNFLDLLRQMPIEKSLISIMIFSPSKSRRSLALELFKNLLYCFEPIGRYKILYSILSQPRQHSGLHGIVIGIYKDLLFTNPIFHGTNLHRVIRSIIQICLPKDSQSELLEKNDCIFAAVNFFRFIYLRDPKSVNATRIWDISVVNDSFINPLYKALEVSRTHYQLELTKLKAMKLSQMSNKTPSARNNKAAGNVEISVMESNKSVRLPEMTIEQEYNVIILALQNFDLLESVLARLKEIAAEQAKVKATVGGASAGTVSQAPTK